MSDFARAERLVELRTARHISREKLASEIDVSTKSVYSWENGGGIRWHNAQRLAAFYGVDPETLVRREVAALGETNQNGATAPGNGQQTQLDRVESKLDRLLEYFGLSDPRDEVEREIDGDDPPAEDTAAGSG
jgi:transcriptional regulator with XRE-family HTH domain